MGLCGASVRPSWEAGLPQQFRRSVIEQGIEVPTGDAASWQACNFTSRRPSARNRCDNLVVYLPAAAPGAPGELWKGPPSTSLAASPSPPQHVAIARSADRECHVQRAVAARAIRKRWSLAIAPAATATAIVGVWGHHSMRPHG